MTASILSFSTRVGENECVVYVGVKYLYCDHTGYPKCGCDLLLVPDEWGTLPPMLIQRGRTPRRTYYIIWPEGIKYPGKSYYDYFRPLREEVAVRLGVQQSSSVTFVVLCHSEDQIFSWIDYGLRGEFFVHGEFVKQSRRIA